MNYGKKKGCENGRKKLTSKSTMQGKRIVVRLFKALLICIVLAAVVGMAGGGLFDKKRLLMTLRMFPLLTLNRKDLLLSFMLMTEALRLNVLYLLVPIEYTSLLMRYRKIFNMLLLQSRMSVFISITV